MSDRFVRYVRVGRDAGRPDASGERPADETNQLVGVWSRELEPATIISARPGNVSCNPKRFFSCDTATCMPLWNQSRMPPSRPATQQRELYELIRKNFTPSN